MSSDDVEGATPPISIPAETIVETMHLSDGALCYEYNGLGRGWHARYNPSEKDYEVAISQNVPEKTDEGLLVRVETKEYWSMGRMGLLNWFPETFTTGRLQPIGYEDTPFGALGDPEVPPIEVRSSE